MTDAAAARPPRVVAGRYTITASLGRGGTAEVLRARDELLGRDVAIKLYESGIESFDAPARLREMRALAAVDHPGLATIYDWGVDDRDRSYLVMQLIDGDSLARRLRHGPFPSDDVLALGAALADVLACLHRHGVVHRDVNPHNILIDDAGHPYLIDFGAAVFADGPTTPDSQMPAGIPSFVAPEHLSGQPLRRPSDVYSLGLVLIRCVTTRREYDGDDIHVARGHRAPQVPPNLPPALRALLDSMTLDAPADRPAAEQVAHELRRLTLSIGRQGGIANDANNSSAPHEADEDFLPSGVFLSYRRATSWSLARLLQSYLTSQGYDVFMDVAHIDSGDFEARVLAEIARRRHFVVVLAGATRFDAVEGEDWMRREIARALVLERNVVPVMSDGFSFARDLRLPQDIARLATANGVTVYPDYFDEAMTRLHERFLRPSTARAPHVGQRARTSSNHPRLEVSGPIGSFPILRAADGRTLEVTERIIIGRDDTCDLSFPKEDRLARRALAVLPRDGGVMLTCLSRTHGLVIEGDGTPSRLAPASDDGPTGFYLLTRGSATVTGPSWDASSFAVTITATIRLRTDTKEFVTALMLCRHRLLEPAKPAAPPEVPQLTRAVLEATNSWHLLRALEQDEGTRRRLTGRILEHLKALRVKLVRGGLADRGARLTPSVVVDLLLASGTITRSHLRLLDDEAWLRAQEAQWWDA